MVAVVRRSSIRSRLAVTAYLGGLIALFASFGPTSHDIDLRYGVSHADAPSGIAIHWVLCGGETAEVVDLEAYQGGSRPPNGVPVFWQIRTDDRAGGPSRLETFVVGETPAGYYETVPFRESRLPPDLIGISAPPGGARSTAGMTFERERLPRAGVIRGGYEMVSLAEFEAQGLAACGSDGASIGQGAGVALLGAGLVVLFTRRRPVGMPAALLVAAIGLLAVGRELLPLRAAGATSGQPAAAFRGGSTPVPDGARVLAELAPRTTRDAGGGFYVARILAEGEYGFAVTCSGTSIQIGEGASLDNGGTGSRQLIGCATGRLVRGSIAARPDRSKLVEVVVDPAASGEWRVIVVEGPGDVGPFDEP